MNQAQRHELNVLIDAAGRQLSAAATALDKAQEANGGKQPTHGLIVAATQEFAKCDIKNVLIQKFSDSLVDEAPPELPPVTPPGPGSWPNPPGVPFLLDAAQKKALFQVENGLAQEGVFRALMPGVDDATLNIYKQFYGPGGGGWGECQYWYAHRS